MIGSTGWAEAEDARSGAAAKQHRRSSRSGNFSLGVNVLAGLVAQAARELAAGGLGHRGVRGPPPAQGRRAVRHGADAGRGGGARAAASTWRRRRCAAATASPARGRTGAIGFSVAARRRHRRRAQRDASPPRTRSSPCPLGPRPQPVRPRRAWPPRSGSPASRPASTTCMDVLGFRD